MTDILPIIEDFYSIQGEGFNTGMAAYFIRLAGCKVRCKWCDSPNTWDQRGGTPTIINDIINKISELPVNNVIITGGEPLLHDLDELCAKLAEAGFNIFLETSGTGSFSGDFDWICLSPKKKSPPIKEIWRRADELKVIIHEEIDFGWAEECRTKVGEDCLLYLQAEWNVRDSMTPIIIDYIKNNPEWSLSLQTHKFINIQ